MKYMVFLLLVGCGSADVDPGLSLIGRANCSADVATLEVQGNTEDLAQHTRAIAHQTQYRQEIITETAVSVTAGQLSATCLGGSYVEFMREP